MIHRRIQIAVAGFGVAALFNSAVFGARLGHPATSVKGATAAQNQVNLISDPMDAIYGVTTSQYDANALFIEGVTASTGYVIDSITIQTTDSTNPYYVAFDVNASDPRGTPVDAVSIQLPQGFEAGAVQVAWELDGEPDTTPITAEDVPGDPNSLGDITHIIQFGTYSEAPAFMTTLSDIASPGGGVVAPDETHPPSPVGTFPDQDTYTAGTTTSPDQEYVIGTKRDISDSTTYTAQGNEDPEHPGQYINQIESSSDTIFVPEPASLTLMGFSATLLLKRRTRAL